MKIIQEDTNFQYCIQTPRRFYYAKNILYPFINLFYHILLKSIHKITSPKRTIYKYQTTLVLIFKDEAPFLQEWLTYHLTLGIDHFYLYQNNSTDNYMEVLSPYIKSGIVTLNEWPDNPGQNTAYMHWYKHYRTETKWVSFLDIDEFICPLRESNIHNLLAHYEIDPVVMIYWKLYGTSGILHHDYTRLVIEQYHVCRKKYFTEGKVFYNTLFDINEQPFSMHGFNVKWHNITIPPVNSFYKFVIWNMHKVNHKKDIKVQINHYWSKAYDCWQHKYEKGSAEKGTKWKNLDFLNKLELNCTSSNYTIFRFIVSVKLKMREYSTTFM